MSTGLKILLGLCVAFFLIGGSFVMFIFGVKNTCVANEKGIEAQYEQNQANLAGYTNKIMDMVQVPAMAKNAIKEIAQAAIQGRYGEKGSQALFQAIQEQNPTVDPGLYRQLMQAMEAGRNSFDADQKTVIDKCRVYETYVESAPQSFFTGFFGYPKYDKTKCKPVITEQTAQDFKTKRTGPLQLQTQ
jgi:hypothetical protein